MRNSVICTVACLAILCAGSVGLAKQRGQRREQKQTTQEDKEWRQKLKAMTPEQRRVAVAQKALETDLAALRQMRKTAVEENAGRTVAQIEKAIAAKEEQSKKLAASLEKRKAGRKGGAAGGSQTQGAGTTEDRKP